MEITELNRSRPTPGSGGDLVTVLAPDGTVRGDTDPRAPVEVRIAMVEAMARTRALEARLGDLKRAGVIPFHSTSGNEAPAVIAATLALGESGWVFPGLRELGAFVARGVSFERYLDHVLGNEDDPACGHSMPGFYTARAERIASVAAPTSGHLSHAVGFAWAARRKGDDAPVGVFFGPGAIDSADFHTGVNFAGVMRVPVVFLCRNSGDRERSVIGHGVAYGVREARCDGGDPLAVYDAVQSAIASGEATLLELAIDPESAGEQRLTAHLEKIGVLDAGSRHELDARIQQELDAAVERSRAKAPVARDTLFAHVVG
jgi:2-oxoisovalerate dehydrogenase E1 component alpha subunit